MKKHLLFVSPRFLFPVDSGGKIRTTQILRGLKGGEYAVTLLSPASAAEQQQHAAAIAGVCDKFVAWAGARGALAAKAVRLAAAFSALPSPVATDRSAQGSRAVREALAAQPSVVVFDFPHAAVLAPERVATPSVLFTHNIEAEIFKRHAQVNSGALKLLWRSQFRKMVRFEAETLRRFDSIVAVSERDASAFTEDYGARNVRVISTGVDLDYFSYAEPGAALNVAFTGSMDWLANRDGIDFMMDEIWPHVAARAAEARMTVVGRSPPAWLVRKAEQAKLNWSFTGFVDDVRPYVHGSGVYVIPLRVGGGTRLKVYEAMAMGCPVVSTTIGVEGLPLVPDKHYLLADDGKSFADAILRLMTDAELRTRLSEESRRFVEEHCSFRAVARQFEQICTDTAREHAQSAARRAG
jgi:glycosyltransferase involved in cell wall biosynthesis